MTSGQVWKYSIGGGTWTNITPVAPSSSDAFGYDGLALDPKKSGTVMVTTVPSPFFDSSSTVPPCASMNCWVSGSPNPSAASPRTRRFPN